MPRRFTRLAWVAASCTYLLIVLGGVVRITDSGMGCGDDWPLCNGRLIPPLGDPATLIEWSHRLVVSLVALPIAALALYAWRLRRHPGPDATPPGRAAYLALGLVVLAAALGRATVMLELPAWTTILHFGTGATLLAALIAAAAGPGATLPAPPVLIAGTLAFATLLFGALTANLGAASACVGFPLCNGQLVPEGNYLQHVHWTHRLLAYAFTGYAVFWAVRERGAGPRVVLGLVAVQVAVAAVMVLGGLPRELQALHLAIGTAVWAAVVMVAFRPAPAR